MGRIDQVSGLSVLGNLKEMLDTEKLACDPDQGMIAIDDVSSMELDMKLVRKALRGEIDLHS